MTVRKPAASGEFLTSYHCLDNIVADLSEPFGVVVIVCALKCKPHNAIFPSHDHTLISSEPLKRLRLGGRAGLLS